MINTKPGFFGNLMRQTPGMVNGLAQQYGGDMKQAAANSSALLNRKPRPQVPSMGPITKGVPSGMGQQLPLPTMPAIQTGPTYGIPGGGMHRGPLNQMSFNNMPQGRTGGLWDRFNSFAR